MYQETQTGWMSAHQDSLLPWVPGLYGPKVLVTMIFFFFFFGSECSAAHGAGKSSEERGF